MKSLRLKDSKDEHDDEEEDVGRQNRHLIDGLLAFYTDVNSICGSGTNGALSQKTEAPVCYHSTSVHLILYICRSLMSGALIPSDV